MSHPPVNRPSVDRSQPPEPAPLRPFHPPSIERRPLAPGFTLHAVRIPQLPVVTAALVLPGNEAVLPVDRAGFAELTADALEGGTRRRSGTALAEAFEAIGADVGIGSGWDATLASISCLADRFDEALDLLAEAVLAPAFPDGEVERVRDQQLARIRQRASDPSGLASDHALRLFYTDGEPYGRHVGGTEASLTTFDADAARTFSERWYRPEGSALVVAGDVDADEAAASAMRIFSGWEGAPPPHPALTAAPRFAERTVHVVHRPGAVQSELRIGHPGVARSAPDHHALVVANAVLGGTFTSRLNLNLRERRGFTYGVRSSFAFRKGAGPFSVSTAVDTAVTAEAVAEIVGEVERFVETGPTADETGAVRDYIAGTFPLRLSTTGQVAGRVADLIVHGLGDDEWLHYRDRVRAVDAASAHRAFAHVVHPDRLVIVVVGDADEVRAPLEALGLGPLTVHVPG